MPTFSSNLDNSLHGAIQLAAERKQEYATLEHLLCSLLDDIDVVEVLEACSIDINLLRADVRYFIDNEAPNKLLESDESPKPTHAFQRVIQRAVIHVQSSGREEVTGARVLVSMFAERDSHAAAFLASYGLTRFDVINYIEHGVSISSEQSIEREFQRVDASIPLQAYSPIQVESRNNRVFVSNLSKVADTNNPKLIETHRWLLEEASEMAGVLSGNSPGLVRLLQKYLGSLGENLENVNIIRLGMCGLAIKGMEGAFADECSALVHGKMLGLLASHAIFINRFHEWREFISEASDVDSEYSAADNGIQEIVVALENEIKENTALFDEAVGIELEEARKTALEEEATSVQRHGLWSGISNIVSQVAELALDQLRMLWEETKKRTRAIAATAVATTALGFISLKAAELLSLSQKFPTTFGWLDQVIKFLIG